MKNLVASVVAWSIVNHPDTVGISFLDLGASIPFVVDAFIIVPYIRRPDGSGSGDGDGSASVMFRVDHCYVEFGAIGGVKKNISIFSPEKNHSVESIFSFFIFFIFSFITHTRFIFVIYFRA